LKDNVTRAEATGKSASQSAGYLGDLPPAAGEATTTGSLAMVMGAGAGAALTEEPGFPESVQEEDGIPASRFTTRGKPWCCVATAMASRAGAEGAWKNTHV
jgi:hypothetical protein